MIIFNESKFAKFCEDARTLEHAFVYMMSKGLELQEEGNTLLGNDKLLSLRPSSELLDKLKSGELSKDRFKKAYFKELSSNESRFIIYTIVRSLNEKKYLPIFVCSDEEWELGFIKVFAKFMKKKFGLKLVDTKAYGKEIKALWKAAKKENKKGKVKKAFKKAVKDYIKDQVQCSFKGIEEIEEMEKEFSIDRIVILLNQTDDDSDEISKKTIIKSIETFADFNKKAKKLIKAAVSELAISKKSDRWSRKDAVNLAVQVYNAIHSDKPAKK